MALLVPYLYFRYLNGPLSNSESKTMSVDLRIIYIQSGNQANLMSTFKHQLNRNKESDSLVLFTGANLMNTPDPQRKGDNHHSNSCEPSCTPILSINDCTHMVDLDKDENQDEDDSDPSSSDAAGDDNDKVQGEGSRPRPSQGPGWGRRPWRRLYKLPTKMWKMVKTVKIVEMVKRLIGW